MNCEFLQFIISLENNWSISRILTNLLWHFTLTLLPGAAYGATVAAA